MLSVGRIFAGDGWRYLWEQVGAGTEDYYLADVARGEAPGRWSGSAAKVELGLDREVTEQQMHRLFGLLAHPTEPVVLGRAPRIYRTVDQRLDATRTAHDEHHRAIWLTRAVELAETRAPNHQVEAEQRAHQARAAEEWAEREAVIRRGGERHAVAGFDLCFSPPKSVSVLWAAADREGRETIWQAHREGVTAALGYLEREAAWSRAGYGGIRQVDTTGWVVASFDHRMSRAGDVQIHTHNTVLNRVRCPDGEWRSIDGRSIYRAAASAGALYDRVREAALERDLGVRHEQRKPDGPREIVGVDDDICRLFSSRRTQIEGRLTELVAASRDRAGGVEPSQWTISRLSQWAALQTRTRKDRHESTAAALARWEAESRDQLQRSLAQVWQRAINAHGGGEAADEHEGTVNAERSPTDDVLLAVAVGVIDAKKSTWTRYELARQLTRMLPLELALDAQGELARIDALVDSALGERAAALGVINLSTPAAFDTPAGLRRAGDGASVYEEHGAARYCTNTGLAAELAVLAGARDCTGPRLNNDTLDTLMDSANLGGDQAAALRQVATSGYGIEALVGPAGTGKTHTMRALARAWRANGGAVIGLALSETATRVLADQAGVRAVNTAKLLFEHQHRSAEQKATRWWQDDYAITPGSLVILDEAGMASRQTIDQIRRLCAQTDSKLLLVGDHEQLDSPAAGGVFRLVVDQIGAAHLADVHRLTASWERAASLRLRAGDPTVLAEYDLRSRIEGGAETAMEDAAFQAAMADRARGLRTYLLADTSEQAARLAARTRQHLVAAGIVDDTHTVELCDGNRAGIGDRIVTRDNDRSNRSGLGQFVANRDMWQVTAVHPGGGVRVARVDPQSDQPVGDDLTDLDADYVNSAVQLDYAGTVHAAQGGTRDACHAIIGARTSRHALYVALTRGRQENRAYVVCCQPEGIDRDSPVQDPLAVLTAILDRVDRPEERAALAVQADEAERARSLKTLFPIWQDMLAIAGGQRHRAAIEAACGTHLADQMIASPVWPTLAARLRILDAAGIDSPSVLARAAVRRGFDDADDVAAVLHWRLQGAEGNARLVIGDTFTELTPPSGGGDDLEAAIAQVATAMDSRSRALADQVLVEQVLVEQPAWAAQLGPLPEQPDRQDQWLRRAGIVAGYQEAFNIEPGAADPIGPIPPTSRPDARAWWQRAAAALDRTEPHSLAQLPDEHLEAIIGQARQADQASPDAVADRLRAASGQLRQARTAHGLALQTRDRIAANRAAEQIDQLNGAVSRLEQAHHRRQQWTTATARLHQQAQDASAELETRYRIREADTPLPDLHRRLAQAKARLESMQATVQRVETMARNHRDRAHQLSTELAALLAHRPATRTAQLAVTSEQSVAARIDRLRHTLTDTRFGVHTVPGKARQQLRAELEELLIDHPSLDNPQDRQHRWETILNEGRRADHDQATALRNQITQASTEAAEHNTLAAACRAERDTRETTYTDLATDITRRAGAPSAHPRPRGPNPPTNITPAETPETPRRTTVHPDLPQQHRASIHPPVQDGPAPKT